MEVDSQETEEEEETELKPNFDPRLKDGLRQKPLTVEAGSKEGLED